MKEPSLENLTTQKTLFAMDERMEAQTSLKTSSRRHRDTQGVLQKVSTGDGDLIGIIRGFLEAKGFELYPMQNGGYQIKSNKQTVRIYVQRKDS